MIFRLAQKEELDTIKNMFVGIVENMNQNNIRIWNQYYPFECFGEDIAKQQLYVLEENQEIIAVCALCDSNDAEAHMEWNDRNAKALYIDRLGVNVNYQGKGYGSLLIKNAMEEARKNQYDYLRLLVVDINQPAMKLYEKNVFAKLNGIYEEKINEKITLKEFAYEIAIKK